MTIALSYSRLSVFEQCEARFDYQYVSKRVKDQSNPASEYGDRVHKTLEAYALGQAVEGIEAEQTLERWGGLVDSLVGREGEKFFEHQMAVNKALAPVDWFAPDVWIRGIADVLVVNKDTAYCLDWKTGKVKENPTQLQLFAAMVMWHFPQVTKVQTSFVWLAYDQMTSARYERRYLGALWDALRPRFERVQETVDLGVFKTKPGGLCPWCPAKDICPDARQQRR
jgi:RecB family exonuclease